MKTILNRALAMALGFALALPIAGIAQDWYEATGKPVQRSLLNSADLRTEFALIESDLAAKMPVLTGNGGEIIAVNAGATALEALDSGVGISQGGTGATTASAARTNLGLAIGSDVQAYDADLGEIAALADTDGNFIVGSASGWVAESGATVRTSLGLGSLATASSVSDSNWSGTDLAIGNGGTGASTAGDARTNLGLGSLATLSSINNSNWSGTDLSLANGGTGASLVDPNADRIGFWDDSAGSFAWLTVGSGLQISTTTLSSTGSGGTVTSVSGAGTENGLTLTGTVTTTGSLTLGGTLAINNGDWSGTDLAVANGGTGASTLTGLLQGNGTGAITGGATINNGNWSGTDLAVVNGGTGASDAGTARSNLGAAAASHNHSAADVTSGTLAVARGGTGQTTMDNVAEQVWLQCTIASDPGGTPTGSAGDCFLYY